MATAMTRTRRCSVRGRRLCRRHLARVRATSGSVLVAALESAYNDVRSEFPELPAVVMITGSGRSAFGLKWAHFGADRWKLALSQGRRPEMFIGGETLAMGAAFTMETLLHETAHGLAMVRGVDDTSRQNRYHNGRFRALAEELGLEWPEGASPHATIGYSEMLLTAAGKARWRTSIERLDKAITASLDAPILATGGTAPTGGDTGGQVGPNTGGGTGGGRRMKFMCSCTPVRTLYMSVSQWERDDVTCGACGERFE